MLVQAARQAAEERLQAVEAAATSNQASESHSQESHLRQAARLRSAQSAEPESAEAESSQHELSLEAAESHSEPRQGFAASLAGQEGAAQVMPDGTTLQVTNPVYRQQDGLASVAAVQMPGASQAPNPNMAAASNTAELANPSMAEPADAAAILELSSQQLKQQISSLHSQLSSQASELQTAEAATEYVQRLLNAVSVENRDLRVQLDRKQILKRSSSELQRSSSSLGSAKALLAQPVAKGLLGLQPATSQIAAMWATSPSVRRSLLPEYGMGKPHPSPGQSLEGAESLVGPSASNPALNESRSGSMRWWQQGDSGFARSELGAQVLSQPSQHEAESSPSSLSGE